MADPTIAELQQRLATVESRAVARDADYKRRNRELMPLTAEFMDKLRQAGLHPAWGKFHENGRTVEFGNRVSRGIPPMPHLVFASGMPNLVEQWRERAHSRRKG